jgi:hypothetical protein
MNRFWLLVLPAMSLLMGQTPTNGLTVAEIIKRSVEASDRNWKAAPRYMSKERDVEEKLDSRGGVNSKTVATYEVMVLDGSEYRKLVERNYHPLSQHEQNAEQRKFWAEKYRREHESPEDRARRIARYRKGRQQDHAMMMDMADAFNFRLIGQDKVDGHDTWVFDATPKPGWVPPNRDTKVLTGMRGKLWVDKSEFQWVKVEAEVMRPVSFYAVATVGPGTRFALEQEPVGDGIWLPRHFSVKVFSTILFFSHNSLDDETYWDYRLASQTAGR